MRTPARGVQPRAGDVRCGHRRCRAGAATPVPSRAGHCRPGRDGGGSIAMKKVPSLLALVVMAGCAPLTEDFNRAPAMSDVGTGVVRQELPPGLSMASISAAPDAGSLWTPSARSLFGDQAARQVGDVLTVEIALKDEARFENRSDRSRGSSVGFGLGLDVPSTGLSTGRIAGDIGTDSESIGRGRTGRSEALKTSVTAMVTEVLPNGNLLISGSQEILVNYEMRVISIAGIVRPFDISSDNRVPYEKIAEARLVYGGRGRLSEVQQPPWGQQLYDRVTPF